MVGHRYRLGVALGLVVDAAQPYGVYVPPVLLGLGVDERVSIDFAGGGKHEARPLGLGEPQSVVGTQSADLQDRDWDALEVCWAGRGGEVVDLVHPSRVVYVGRHVVVYVLKVRVLSKVGYVLQRAGP